MIFAARRGRTSDARAPRASITMARSSAIRARLESPPRRLRLHRLARTLAAGALVAAAPARPPPPPQQSAAPPSAIPRLLVYGGDLVLIEEIEPVVLPKGRTTVRLDFVRGNADVNSLDVTPLDRPGGARASLFRRDDLGNATFVELDCSEVGRAAAHALRRAGISTGAHPSWNAAGTPTRRAGGERQRRGISRPTCAPLATCTRRVDRGAARPRPDVARPRRRPAGAGAEADLQGTRFVVRRAGRAPDATAAGRSTCASCRRRPVALRPRRVGRPAVRVAKVANVARRAAAPSRGLAASRCSRLVLPCRARGDAPAANGSCAAAACRTPPGKGHWCSTLADRTTGARRTQTDVVRGDLVFGDYNKALKLQRGGGDRSATTPTPRAACRQHVATATFDVVQSSVPSVKMTRRPRAPRSGPRPWQRRPHLAPEEDEPPPMNPTSLDLSCITGLAAAAALARDASAQQPVRTGPEGFVEVVVPTSPDGVTLRLTSDQPADVAETRRIAPPAGRSRLRFDWSREHLDEGRSASTSRSRAAARRCRADQDPPPRRHDLLRRRREAPRAATITSRYLLSGIGWRVDYVGEMNAAGGSSRSRSRPRSPAAGQGPRARARPLRRRRARRRDARPGGEARGRPLPRREGRARAPLPLRPDPLRRDARDRARGREQERDAARAAVPAGGQDPHRRAAGRRAARPDRRGRLPRHAARREGEALRRARARPHRRARSRAEQRTSGATAGTRWSRTTSARSHH